MNRLALSISVVNPDGSHEQEITNQNNTKDYFGPIGTQSFHWYVDTNFVADYNAAPIVGIQFRPKHNRIALVVAVKAASGEGVSWLANEEWNDAYLDSNDKTASTHVLRWSENSITFHNFLSMFL